MSKNNRHQSIGRVRAGRDPSKGIVAVRRKISPESLSSFQTIVDELNPELQNAARLFTTKMLGVTVVGFSRFDKRHIGKGPATRDVTRKVDSCRYPIDVQLDRFAIFGSNNKGKLGICLESDELVQETQDLEDEFASQGFPLRKDHNSEDGYTPHCSIALIYNDKLQYFHDDRTLVRLEAISGFYALDRTVRLEPVLPEL